MNQSIELKTINEKLDMLILKMQEIHILLMELSAGSNERKEVLEKNKNTLNNIHRMFGGTSVDFQGLFNRMLSTNQDDCDSPRSITLAIEDSDNPFN